jgi:hypothetical protein
MEARLPAPLPSRPHPTTRHPQRAPPAPTLPSRPDPTTRRRSEPITVDRQTPSLGKRMERRSLKGALADPPAPTPPAPPTTPPPPPLPPPPPHPTTRHLQRATPRPHPSLRGPTRQLVTRSEPITMDLQRRVWKIMKWRSSPTASSGK